MIANNYLHLLRALSNTDEQLIDIMHNEKGNSQLFNLAQGLVFRCHLVYYKEISSDGFLSDKDALIFNFHHALFDFPSMNVFLHDLDQVYKTSQLSKLITILFVISIVSSISTIISCSLYSMIIDFLYMFRCNVIEQEMPMTGASMFWLDILHDCNLDRSLPLPYDRYRLSDEHRTGRGTSISFDFGQDLSHHFLHYASSNNITS